MSTQLQNSELVTKSKYVSITFNEDELKKIFSKKPEFNEKWQIKRDGYPVFEIKFTTIKNLVNNYKLLYRSDEKVDCPSGIYSYSIQGYLFLHYKSSGNIFGWGMYWSTHDVIDNYSISSGIIIGHPLRYNPKLYKNQNEIEIDDKFKSGHGAWIWEEKGHESEFPRPNDWWFDKLGHLPCQIEYVE